MHRWYPALGGGIPNGYVPPELVIVFVYLEVYQPWVVVLFKFLEGLHTDGSNVVESSLRERSRHPARILINLEHAQNDEGAQLGRDPRVSAGSDPTQELRNW